MRFLVGVIVGIAIARPAMAAANEHVLTPPVRRKVVDVLSNLTSRINERIDSFEQENNR